MIIVTHSTIGASLGAILGVSSPTSFLIGLVTHYISDMIPHKEYPVTFNRYFQDGEIPPLNIMLRDSWKLILDLLLSVLMVLLISYISSGDIITPAIFFGALGAILPDILQPIALVMRGPFKFIYLIHNFFHSKRLLENNIYAFASQVLIIFMFLLSVTFLT